MSKCISPVLDKVVCVGLWVVQADFNQLGQFCGGNNGRRQLGFKLKQLHFLSFLQHK